MRKRTAIASVGIFAAAIAVAAFFIMKEKKVVVVDPWVAVPSDAFFIVETHDFPELLTSTIDPSGLAARLSEMKWAASLVKAASLIDSLTGSREVRELISNKKVLISFHVTGQNRIAPLAVMNTGISLTPRRLRQLCSSSGATITDRRELGGAKTFTLTYGRGTGTFNVAAALTSGIIIISSSEALVANALNNKNTGSDIRHQQGFAPVVDAAGKDDDNVYLLFRNLSRFIKSFVSEDKITRVTNAAIAGGGDLTVKQDGLYISGFLSTAGAGQGADKISQTTPGESGVHELLPAGTISYRTEMKRSVLSGEQTSDPASINATDLALALSIHTGTEVTEAIIRTGRGDEKVILFRMTDRQAGESVLRDKLTAKYRSMGLRDSHFLLTLKDEKEEETVIYKMPFTGVASVLSGTASMKDIDGWAMFVRSYMVFSASTEALAALKKESDRDNTLINDPEFREMEKTLPTKSSFIFYSSGGGGLKSLVDGWLTNSASQMLTGQILGGISGVGLSLTPSNNMIYVSLSVRYNDRQQERAGGYATPVTQVTEAGSAGGEHLKLAWKVKLDADPTVKPFMFLNHNTGATEIFIQDQENNIYLISSSGKILWKAPVRERITGDMFMIDYYKNGKNQILFSGREYLHLIDRNGNYVDRFPVKMRSPASNTLAVFDYEKNKEYRLAVAGEDRKIYMYDRSGQPVRGWNQFLTAGKVTDPVSFFRVRGKDYLFIADDQTVYLLDRTGNIRVNLQEPLKKAWGSSVRLTEDDAQAIVFTSPEGTVIKLALDGSAVKQKAGTFSDQHRSDFADIDGDGRTDYIFAEHGMLSVYDNTGAMIYSKTFKTADVSGPFIFSYGVSDTRLAMYETGSKNLYLIDRTGNTTPGFPLKAGPFFTAARLSGRNSLNLLVSESDGYLCNYELIP